MSQKTGFITDRITDIQRHTQYGTYGTYRIEENGCMQPEAGGRSMAKQTAAKRIRRLREDCGMTQAQLAERVHVSRSSVQSWECAQTYPSIDSCIALSKIFHVSTDYLIAESRHKTVSLEACSDRERQLVRQMLTLFDENMQTRSKSRFAGRW